MKRMLCAILLLSFLVIVLASCGIQESDQKVAIKNNSADAQKEEQESIPDAETEVKDVIRIQHSEISPDLSFTLSVSDIVVDGTILEKISEGHSNPSGTEKNACGENIPYGIVTKYLLRVDKVYFGEVNENDIITIDTSFDTGVSMEDMNKVEIISDETPIELTDGDNAIFCLAKDDIWVKPEDGDVYIIVHDDWGIFDYSESDDMFYSKVYSFKESELTTLIEGSKIKWNNLLQEGN